jgi:hypothetical protein
MSQESLIPRPGFDPAMAGKLAECDGGGPLEGTLLAVRQEFAGTLTGEYFDQGDPPWRWYRMVDLSRKPDGWAWDAVWCERGNIFLAGE